jgi:adenylate cyclase
MRLSRDRVGMDHVPAVHRAGDWFGPTIHLAARVSGLAHGEEVLLTDATREAAGKVDGVRFQAHGAHRLRNVTAPVKVFSAVAEAGARRGLVIDSVCRMAADPDGAAGTLEHGGRRDYFCSLECAARFAGDPEFYAKTEEL